MKLKKEFKETPEGYWHCPGCNKRVSSFWTTTEGRRCVKCVVNNNMIFLLEDGRNKTWTRAKWYLNDTEVKKL